ncbi:hypothetical protein Hanom_Chr16g01481631 [Helianthus anomalus]
MRRMYVVSVGCMKSWIIIMKNKRLKIRLERNKLYVIAGQRNLYLYVTFNSIKGIVSEWLSSMIGY